MAARRAPTIGFTAACVLLTGIGLATIKYAGQDSSAVRYAGAVIGPESGGSATTPASTSPAGGRVLAARPVAPAPAGSPTGQLTRTPTSAPSAPASPSRTTTGSGGSQSRRLTAMSPEAGTSNLSYARSVFQAINEARAGQHLPPLSWSSRLQQSARQHNAAMAMATTLAHQVGSEPNLGAREMAAGVHWRYAAENIGWTTARNRSGALAIEASMFAETPPSDAHRRNILSTTARAVGIDVLIDTAHGRLWLTEDFSDAG